ncbi:hypothetical protein [Streptomyces sp. ISL-11]|uniref:hypothetical protein n=1 Tax=Streptomyces sp. ISL-11 TaxID=2819174 RepID=UPI001BEC03F8|nr:hypothetical protein [Streptomyces sp. ISL-11]MBT2382854.1 hypothetical protein [Streptomyces sp. ISL-11]
MSDPVARAGADLRLFRAAVFTAVCVLLSAGGHVLASCASVPLWTLGAGFALVLAAAVPLAGRERSLPGIAAALAAGQLALHTLFGLGQHDAGVTPRQAGSEGSLITFAAKLICNQPHPMSATEARRVITDAGIDPSVHPMPVAAPTPAPPGSLLDLLPTSLPMLLGHLLAALAAGWLLRRGDVALWRVVGLSERSARAVAEAALVRALRSALTLVRALWERVGGKPVVPARGAYREEERPAAEPVLQHVVIRRGPPVCALAA